MRDENVEQAINEANETLHRPTEVDYLIVADRAEVANGKLYMMGGGWDRIQPPQFPFSLMLGIAVGLRVPYHETEDAHRLRVVLDRDGQKLFEFDAEVQTGRPPGMRGRDTLVPMAFNFPITIAQGGDCVLSASVDGRPPRRHSIRIAQQGTL